MVASVDSTRALSSPHIIDLLLIVVSEFSIDARFGASKLVTISFNISETDDTTSNGVTDTFLFSARSVGLARELPGSAADDDVLLLFSCLIGEYCSDLVF